MQDMVVGKQAVPVELLGIALVEHTEVVPVRIVVVAVEGPDKLVVVLVADRNLDQLEHSYLQIVRKPHQG